MNFTFRRFGTICSIFIVRVNKKNNRKEFASAFIQLKILLKNSLSHSDGEVKGDGVCPSRETGCGG